MSYLPARSEVLVARKAIRAQDGIWGHERRKRGLNRLDCSVWNAFGPTGAVPIYQRQNGHLPARQPSHHGNTLLAILIPAQGGLQDCADD